MIINNRLLAKMITVLLLTSVLFMHDNKEFFETVEQQRLEGYRWHSIHCRDADPTLPAIVINTPTGRKIVCHKLQ